MRLKSLKLSGFKSFANPTTFTFRHGITAIVGPNGCGKSNVIDAIRWVLGESSAKQLRGGAMSDVIFAGTEDKAAKSLASVELTFEHTQDEHTGIRHELNLYHELSVRRQINAEGKSDYFINGTRCRRRDVVDVFLGTGLGPRSYSVIQQGMIGRIVDSSPMQLREFIEEAAGVSRYQARREETQKKLFKTHENLERLSDIEAELIRQKNKLQKQAQSAHQYEQIKAKLSEVRQQLIINQLYQAKASEIKHKAQQEQAEKSLATQHAQDTKLKNKLVKVSARLTEEQWLKDEARDKLHQQDMQRQQIEHSLSNLQATINQLEERRQDNLGRQQKLQVDQATAQQDHEQHTATLKRLSPELEALQAQQYQMQTSYAPLQAAWEASHVEVRHIETQQRELEQSLALDKQSQSRLTQDLSKWQQKDKLWRQDALTWGLVSASQFSSEQSEHLTSNDANCFDNSQILASEIADIDKELNSLDRQQESIEAQLDTEQPVIEQLKQLIAQRQMQLAQLEKQQVSLMAEYDTLHAIVHPKKQSATTQYTDSKDLVFKASEAIDNKTSIASVLETLPPLYEHIKLTKAGEKYADFLDKWLAFWFDARILLNSNSSHKGKGSAEGVGHEHLTLLQGLLSDKSWSQQDNQTIKDSKNEQNKKEITANSVLFISTSRSILETKHSSLPPNLKPLSELIAAPKLAVWQQAYLYLATLESESEMIAPQVNHLLDNLPAHSLLLTQSGWIIGYFGAVHLSKLNTGAQNVRFLSVRIQQQQRLAVLEDSLNDVEEKIEQLAKALKADSDQQQQLLVVVEELNAQVTTIIHKRHELQQHRLALRAKQEREEGERQRLLSQRTELDAEHQEMQQVLAQLDNKIKQATTQLAALVPGLKSAKAKQQQLEQQRQHISEQERESSERLRQRQLKYTQAELAAKHSEAQLSQYQADLKQLRHSEQNIKQQQDTAQNSLPQIQDELKVSNRQHHELQVALEERQAVISTLQAQVCDYQAQRNQLEQALQQLQDKLANSVTQVAIANERVKESSERLEQLNPDISVASVLTDFIAHGRIVSDNKYYQLQLEEAKLSTQLENIGPVNLAAAVELEVVNKRLLPLEQQIKDITASMETLVEAIATIDGKTKALFLQTLQSVNASLTYLFTKVFGGGQASLTLIKENGVAASEQWRSGLELMAQPKGKRNSRLAVLSGGEKTLTALSLIFAIFKQHPAPFCVLDEVDAPLDDANVGRFTNLITELAEDVQFIFISHNKLAMQIADELKGVTMPQAGVSTLVSVSLEEAVQYIDATA